MKKTFLGFGLVLSLSLVAGAVAVATRETPYSVSASSYSVRSVPTTIDLNDTSESEIRSYYAGLNSLSTSERQGTNLLKNLKPILKNGQKYLSYGSSATTAVWKAYEIVDRDWEKSPASAISGYNPTSKIITGYSYGSSNTNPGTNPYLHALYVNRDAENETRAWGDHTQTNYGINQEHVWPKSLGFENNTPAAGARGDLMHLWAGNGRVNGVSHNNYPYGYVNKAKTYDDAGSYRSYLSGNLKGYSKTLGGSVTVFEPQDSDKGDIARCCFYMAARYNYLSGSDSDGIDAGNPNLEITNNLSDWSNSGYQSTTTKTGKMSIIQDLLEWNRIDPPDEWEKHRNNILYTNFTNNRNPFIDFPEWAEFIWGKSVDGSYSTTSTGFAAPSADAISTFAAHDPSVSISQTSASVEVGKTVTLSAVASDSSTITWSSSAPSVASVEGGVVTGIAAGSAVITAKATIEDVEYSANCTVTVTEPVPVEGSVTISMSSVTLTEGDSTTLTASASDSSAITWSSSAPGIASVDGGVVMAVSAGQATITAAATIAGKLCQATCLVTVNPKPIETPVLSGLSLDTTNVKTSFEEGSTFTSEGLIVTAEYSNGTKKTVTPTQVSEPDMSSTTAQKVTVSYTEGDITKSASYTIVVNKKSAPAIAATCSKDFFVGQTIKASDIIVTQEAQAITDFEFTDYQFRYEDAASGGAKTEKSFIVKHGESSCVLAVLVSRAEPTDDLSALNLANLIMFKDSDWMSDEDWAEAIDLFESLSKEERVTFLTAEDYVLGSANKRFSEALVKLGKSLVVVDGDYVIADGLSATCAKTFFVGDTIKKTDVSVKTSDGKTITDFEFPDYQFGIDDAASGGNPTQKSFTIESGFSSCTLSVTVSRKAATNADTAADLANFLMYKDKGQMTESDWTEAIRRFNAMTKEERLSFMTNPDYVTKLARTRFVSELSARGKPIYTSNGDYQISGSEREEPKQGGIPNLYLYIAIGAGALLVLVIVIIILVHSKKARKLAKKAAKKAIKSSAKKKK